MASIKQQLYTHCLAYVEQRISTAQKAMDEAQASANEESKSSAGDKYETGRAMMQLEKEKNASQLAEASKLKQALYQIQPEKKTNSGELGSLVYTDHDIFYLAISLGKIKIEQEFYFIISPVSPIGQMLLGAVPGDVRTFNGKSFLIKQIE